jgi:cytoskeleton protein RodZ
MPGGNGEADEAFGLRRRASVTVGGALRSARESRRLSLEQVAAELRMESALLIALEEDRFEALGAPVFVKGYLKHYGARLGLEHEQLLSLYHQQAGAQEAPMKPRRSIYMEDAPPATGRFVAVAAVALLVAGSAWWLYGTRGDSPAGEPVPTESPAPAEAAQRTVMTAADERRTPRVEAPPAAESEFALPRAEEQLAEELPAVHVVAAHFAEGEPAAPAEALAEPEPPADTPQAAAGALTAETISDATMPQADLLRIEMSMEADCWTEVTDARGARLYYGLAEAGASLSLEGEAPVSFVLGNADAVRLVIGGNPYPVPRQGRRGQLARFTVGEP